MFYSHTFLARKGPLGTVWCAAHLQHKLRKSHYISTDVRSTVDRIMTPEVPIALRMSGHLLLGVVRIYSKQVDYLYEDCNEISITINRVFTSVNVNLPLDAVHAPPHSITFPEKLNLEAMDLDDYKDLGEDSNFKSLDEITLPDQIPTGNDPYTIIRFNEDLIASSQIENISEIGPTPMDEDVLPPDELNTSLHLEDPSNVGPSNINVGNATPQNLRSAEIQRTAAHGFDFNISAILSDRAAPDIFLVDKINKDKEVEHRTLSMEDEMSPPIVHFSAPHVPEEQEPSLGVMKSPTPFELPPDAEQPKVRKRTRRLLIDDKRIVWSNRYMKNLLNDTSDITRERGNCDLSSLDIWRMNKRLRLRKEDVIFDPYINGACADLQAIHSKDQIKSRKFQLSPDQEPHQETNVAQPPIGNDIEFDILRNNEYASPERDIVPPIMNDAPSSVGKNFHTPENSNLGLQSETAETTGNGDGLLPTDPGTSGYLDSGVETPDTFQHTALSDIPELTMPSPGELGFLDQEDNSTAGPDGTPELGTFSRNNRGTPELQALSSRTRAVAQYLKSQSPNSDDQSEDLSLNKILEGKPRKICARMFYETLVLKSHGLVDARQESSYDDVVLKVTRKLSKGQFAG